MPGPGRRLKVKLLAPARLARTRLPRSGTSLVQRRRLWLVGVGRTQRPWTSRPAAVRLRVKATVADTSSV